MEVACSVCDHPRCGSCSNQTIKVPAYRKLSPGLTRAEPFDVSETSFVYRLQDTTDARKMDRRLLTAEQGYISTASRRARQGDLLCVLYGCSVPVILRSMLGSKAECQYELVGECYLDGFMGGTAINLDAKVQVFCIC